MRSERVPANGDPLLSHAVALAINIAFGDEGLLNGTISGRTVDDGPYANYTPRMLLDEAEDALEDEDRSTSKYSDLIDAMTGFNEEAYGCNDEPPTLPECPEGETRNDMGECVPPEEECPEGETRNDMGECVPPEEECPEGETRNDMGECVPVVPEQPDAPDCPAGVGATANDGGSITLSWTAADGATTYNVYRGPNADSMTLVGTTTETSFTDETTEAGNTYTYRVTAVGPGGESEDCGVIEATAIPFFPSFVVGALALVGAVGAYAVVGRKR